MSLENYEVLKANSPDDLATLVNAALTAGKVLVGSVYVDGPCTCCPATSRPVPAPSS